MGKIKLKKNEKTVEYEDEYDAVVVKSGNGASIRCSKKYLGKKVKVIVLK